MESNLFYPRVEKKSVTISQEAQRFLSYSLRIIEYGSVITQTDNPHGEKFSYYHRLNYIVSGFPTYSYGNTSVELEPGCMVYLPPNMTLSFPQGEAVELLFVNFEVGALDLLVDFKIFMESLFNDLHIHDRGNNLYNMLRRMQYIGEHNEICAGLEIQNLFENLFLHMIRFSNRFQKSSAYTESYDVNNNLNRAMHYINTNLHHNFKLSEMSDSLHVSENYLYKIFKSQTGKSPTEFISELRMDMAKAALSNFDLSVKAIASHLGYPDVPRFSNTFKKYYGISPRDYRKNLLAEHRQRNVTYTMSGPET